MNVSFRAFLAEMISSLDSEAISSLNELAAVLHILAVIKHSEFPASDSEDHIHEYVSKEKDKSHSVTSSNASSGQSKVSLKSAATSVQQQLHKHAALSMDGTDIQRWDF